MVKAFQFPQIFDPLRGIAILTSGNTLTNTTKTLLYVYLGEQRGVTEFGCTLKDFYYQMSNDFNLEEIRRDLEAAIRRNFAEYPNLLQGLEVLVDRGSNSELLITVKSPVEMNVIVLNREEGHV